MNDNQTTPPHAARKAKKVEIAVADLELAAAKLDRFALDLPVDRRSAFADTAVEAIDAAMTVGDLAKRMRR